jgi:hypothetical protein
VAAVTGSARGSTGDCIKRRAHEWRVANVRRSVECLKPAGPSGAETGHWAISAPDEPRQRVVFDVSLVVRESLAAPGA